MSSKLYLQVAKKAIKILLDAHKMIDDVIESIKVARGNIDETFSKWYEEILKLLKCWIFRKYS